MIREVMHQLGRLFTWLLIVAPWEQALRVRWGRHVRLLNGGTYIRIPFIDRVYRQSVRRRLSIIPPQTLTTKDGRAITVGAAIGYAIVDLRKLYDTLHDAADTIQSAVSARVASYVATHTFDECRPEQIEAHVRDGLTLGEYGLGSTEFYITNFAAVKTYRFITGEMRSWSNGQLCTTEADAPAAAR